jgi:hypothetical protein
MTASNSVAARRESCQPPANRLLQRVVGGAAGVMGCGAVGERLADGRVVDEPIPYDTINGSSKGELPCFKSVTGPNQNFDVPTKYVAESLVTLAMCAKAVCTVLKSAACVT